MFKKVAIFADFDLTLTEEYQQIPLVNHYLEQYKKFYNDPKILEHYRKFDPTFSFKEPEDFFKILHVKRDEILVRDKTSRIQNGITWLGQLLCDKQEGHPLEDLTLKKLYELGKQIKMTTGCLECFIKLKEDWKNKGIDVHIFVVSVGLKTLIRGAIDGYMEINNIDKNPIDGIYSAEISENIVEINNVKKHIFEIISVIEDYSKTEIAYEIAKGGKINRDKKFTGNDYIIPHNKFIVLGDGFSDIPMFRFFRKKGGKGIMVYKKGCMSSYLKARSNSFDNVDYLLERDYTPIPENPLWYYLNKVISDVSYKECKHSEVSIYNYKWSKEMCKSEEQEIVNHLSKCKEHKFGFTLTYVVPRN
jgi:2-hydroxy-3-keto-5-methylthiopentenyl-1-phosphate phosphatase